tara:strand:+ start:1405 stop:2016 length:612 start_codon:yes stop_codon:yes gene_type:complete
MNSDGIPIHTGRVNLSSAGAMSVYADTMPAPTADDNGRKGWLFTKAGGTEKLNYYIYGEGRFPVTLAELENLYCIASVDTYSTTASVPFFVIYTKMQGDGQDGGSWYRSKITYSIATNAQITLGMRTQFSIHSNPLPSYPLEHVVCNQTTVVGPNDPSEEILTMSVQSDSAAPVGTKILVSYIGYKERNRHAVSNPNILLSSN